MVFPLQLALDLLKKCHIFRLLGEKPAFFDILLLDFVGLARFMLLIILTHRAAGESILGCARR